MDEQVVVLPGQATLIGSWRALATTSPRARLVHRADSVAAVFPAWTPLNNAIMVSAPQRAASRVASKLSEVFAAAGVDAWAMWVPSRVTTFDGPDLVPGVSGLERDTTTLVMRATLVDGLRRHGGVLPASIPAATRAAGDAPVPVDALGDEEAVPGLSAWVMTRGDVAVAGLWAYRHEEDCGIYTVGTLPQWRRRGLARTLLEHVLADTHERGARTATLQSTRMGQSLYESLGFVPVGRYEEWVTR